MGKRNPVLDKFATDVCEYIYSNDLDDMSDNLILDYIEGLYNKGVKLDQRDVEKEIYIFYHYHTKYNGLLLEIGEDKFIDIITDAEIEKQVEKI